MIISYIRHRITEIASMVTVLGSYFRKASSALSPLNDTKTGFGLIAINESIIVKNKPPIKNINFKNYSFQSCPIEFLAGDTLSYHNDILSNKPGGELSI